MGTTRDIFLESEGIAKMVFSHFKHTSLVSMNCHFPKELTGDQRVITNYIYPCNSKCHSKTGFIS